MWDKQILNVEPAKGVHAFFIVLVGIKTP